MKINKYIPCFVWPVILICCTGYLFLFAAFLLERQEEMQLFIPLFSAFKNELLMPGGICRIAGKAITQYYGNALFASFSNALFICLTGYFCYLLFQRMAKRSYHLFLAFIPVIMLLCVHIQFIYLIDGTLALTLATGLLYLSVLIPKRIPRLIFNLLSLPFCFFCCGELVAIYGLCLTCIHLYLFPVKQKEWILYGLSGFLLAFAGFRRFCLLPLTDGFKPLSYHLSSLQSDSFIYRVWIYFGVLFILLSGLIKIMSLISVANKKRQLTLTAFSIIAVAGSCYFLKPTPAMMLQRMLDQMAWLTRRERWDQLIGMHSAVKQLNTINRNYLNLALAAKGELGERLFHFDQYGPQGILPAWDNTYLMSVLLSDIHYQTGDITTSESYALEALTLSRRGGSPRMLQRLIQINMIRKEWHVAGKYLAILAEMPCYRDWAQQYKNYHESGIRGEQISGFEHKSLPHQDQLLCMLDLQTLWQNPSDTDRFDDQRFNFLGSALLLAREDEEFIKLITTTDASFPEVKWPTHFQEAALLHNIDKELIQRQIDPRIKTNFQQFGQEVNRLRQAGLSPESLQTRFGNTYWYYYYLKGTNHEIQNR